MTIRATALAPRADRAVPVPSFARLVRLTDDTGLFEHARHATVRREHGYCTDDVARGLVVTSRETDPSPEVLRLAAGYLAFLTHAQDTVGASCRSAAPRAMAFAALGAGDLLDDPLVLAAGLRPPAAAMTGSPCTGPTSTRAPSPPSP